MNTEKQSAAAETVGVEIPTTGRVNGSEVRLEEELNAEPLILGPDEDDESEEEEDGEDEE